MSEAAGQGQAPAIGLPDGMPPEARHDGRGRGDTRGRIQQIAVELFTEQGYEKTSLREIAERLEVTKAALYYHFKSKEDIVASLVEDYYGQVDALITWAQGQPRTAATRTEILRRYVGLIAEGDTVFRMLHQNQAAVNTLASSKSRSALFRERLGILVEMLIEPGGGTPGAGPRRDGARRRERWLDALRRRGGRQARAVPDSARRGQRADRHRRQRGGGRSGRLTPVG